MSTLKWINLVLLFSLVGNMVDANYTVYLQVSAKQFSGSAAINYIVLKGNLGTSDLINVNTYPNGTVNPNLLQDGQLLTIVNKFPDDYGYINTVSVGNYGDTLTMQSLNIYDNKRNLWSNMTFIYPIGYIQIKSSVDFLYPVNGSWSDWSSWGTCSVTCGNGTTTRQRTCNNPSAVNGGSPCNDSSTQWQICVTSVCPVNGQWNSWSSWSSCSVTCGSDGTINRIRVCNSPPPLNGGLICLGNTIETQMCTNITDCPVNGQWNSWSSWSSCSVTYGSNGTIQRTRVCDNPPPTNNGFPCPGNSSETDTCTTVTKHCPVNGQWNSWSSWSSCSVTCGSNGTIQRTRVCDNPPPTNNGLICPDKSSETQMCTNVRDCPESDYVTMDLFNSTIDDINNDISKLRNKLLKQNKCLKLLRRQLRMMMEWRSDTDSEISFIKRRIRKKFSENFLSENIKERTKT